MNILSKHYPGLQKVQFIRVCASLLIGIVFFFNLQCAFLFFLFPQNYAPQFGLTPPVGPAMIQAIAVLFLMWNVPYLVALINPLKYRTAVYEAVCMQSIGVVGESIILLTQKSLPIITQSSLLRFIIFDTAGLFFLLIALVITRPGHNQT